MIVCPHCQYLNNETMTECEKCEEPLYPADDNQPGTRKLDIEFTEAAIAVESVAKSTFTDKTRLVLTFNNKNKQTLKINDGEEISFGRSIKRFGGNRPSVNLEPLNAGEYGVSRTHAKIKRLGEQLFLIDLNSTNGSYLNLERIPPDSPFMIHDGDVIRLGLFDIIVTFV